VDDSDSDWRGPRATFDTLPAKRARSRSPWHTRGDDRGDRHRRDASTSEAGAYTRPLFSST